MGNDQVTLRDLMSQSHRFSEVYFHEKHVYMVWRAVGLVGSQSHRFSEVYFHFCRPSGWLPRYRSVAIPSL